MNTRGALRRIPTEDSAWLIAALRDALAGGQPVQPIASEDAPRPSGAISPDTALVVHTSGSTGKPKFVELSADALRSSAQATNETLGGPGQWLVTLPSHLIAGVQMLVRSILADTTPVFTRGPFTPKKFFAQAARLDHERLYVSLVPVQLSRLMAVAAEDRAALAALQRFNAVLVGGQAIPLALRQQAHELGIALRRTYGMTETAGGVVYDGVEIGDALVRVRDGEVQLGGSTLAHGYVGDEALTESAFVHDGDTRWFRTGDAGELLGGMLTVTGRLDRVIVSGGVNVSLDEVERVAAEAREWSDAVVVPVPSDEWGERVVIVTERRAHADDSQPGDAFDRLCAKIRDELGAAAVPIRWVTLDSLPRLVNGKPDHREIARLVTREAS